MAYSVRLVIFAALFGCALASTDAQETRLIFREGGTQTDQIIWAHENDPDPNPARMNDLGEVVWSERPVPPSEIHSIFSSTRGLILSQVLSRRPDINNSAEVVWIFGDGGQRPNGVESSVQGIVRSGGPPLNGEARISNNSEIVWAEDNSIWSSVRGRLANTPSGLALNLEINDSGEVVCDTFGINSIVFSTTRGVLTSPGLQARNPDINKLGEIVWQQSAVPLPAEAQWEIWSSVRGRIGPGQNPSINDAGEIVWDQPVDRRAEIFSSVRGRLTFNELIIDERPEINNAGDILWFQRDAPIPEPSSALLAALAIAIICTRMRQSAVSCFWPSCSGNSPESWSPFQLA